MGEKSCATRVNLTLWYLLRQNSRAKFMSRCIFMLNKNKLCSGSIILLSNITDKTNYAWLKVIFPWGGCSGLIPDNVFWNFTTNRWKGIYNFRNHSSPTVHGTIPSHLESLITSQWFYAWMANRIRIVTCKIPITMAMSHNRGDWRQVWGGGSCNLKPHIDLFYSPHRVQLLPQTKDLTFASITQTSKQMWDSIHHQYCVQWVHFTN